MTTARRFDDETARKRGRRVSKMFDRIAPTYDLLNHLLSLNIDTRWRKQAVAMLGLTGTERVLDACCGTGDLAQALPRRRGRHGCRYRLQSGDDSVGKGEGRRIHLVSRRRHPRPTL